MSISEVWLSVPYEDEIINRIAWRRCQMTIEESVSLTIKLLTCCEDVVHSILWITKR